MTRSLSSSTASSIASAPVEEDPGVGDLVRSVWNQLRFGWTVSVTPSFTPDIPIHFLGRRYIEFSDNELKNIPCGQVDGDLEAFLADFQSRLWFTYRDSFPPLPVPHYDSGSDSASSAFDPPVAYFRSTAVLRRHLRDSNVPPTLGSSPAKKIPLSVRTSDCGWGCTMRSAQMLLAQTLITHFLGRDWTYAANKWVSSNDPSASLHRQIIRWFADSPTNPLSIHKLIEASGSPPGTMFGPAAICRALVIAMAMANTGAAHGDCHLSDVEVYLARDRVICTEEVLDLLDQSSTSPKSPTRGDQNGACRSHAGGRGDAYTSTSPFGDLANSYVFDSLLAQTAGGRGRTSRRTRHRGLLLLLPMRLGAGDRVDAAYVPTLLRLLRDPAFAGLIGGKPRHSVFVAGVQDDRLIYLDPHFCQEAVEVAKNSDKFDVSSWHCTTPRVMQARRLDPSLAIGFYCASQSELSGLLARLPRVSEVRSPTNHSRHQLIEVVSASEARHLFPDPQPHLSAPLYPPIDEDADDDVDDVSDF
uniref:Cysteine protease n=1 Tax=Mesocestoides corti TaxID=53468 RepID=A0A5K3FI79_MESCO